MRVFKQMAFLGGLAATIVGCSGGPNDMPEVGTVEGVVTLDGQPVPNAKILFKPLEGGRTSNGVSDADGHYTVRYKPSVPGAKVGKHRVEVWTATDEDGDPGTETYTPAGEETIPEKYHGEDSELEVEVKPSDNQINLEMTS